MYGLVVWQHQRRETSDARIESSLREFVDERAAYAAASPAIGNGSRQFRCLWMLGRTDLASDAHGTPVLFESEERLLLTVIELREVAEVQGL